METFLHYALPIYVIPGAVMFVMLAIMALIYYASGVEKSTRIVTFWMFAMLVWPLVAVYYISKAVLLILVTGYKGALVVMRGK